MLEALHICLKQCASAGLYDRLSDARNMEKRIIVMGGQGTDKRANGGRGKPKRHDGLSNVVTEMTHCISEECIICVTLSV